MFRRILIFSSNKSPLRQILKFFQLLGFDVECSDQSYAIKTTLGHEADSLLLFVLDESLGREQSLDLLMHARQTSHNLSTLYVEGSRNRIWGKSSILPSMLLDPTFDCDQIKIHASYLLRERLFPELLIDRVHEAIGKHIKGLYQARFEPGIPRLRVDHGTLRSRINAKPKLDLPVSVHYAHSGLFDRKEAKCIRVKRLNGIPGSKADLKLFSSSDLLKITEDLAKIVEAEFFEHHRLLNLSQSKSRSRLPSLIVPYQVGDKSEALYMTWLASWRPRAKRCPEQVSLRVSLQPVQDFDASD